MKDQSKDKDVKHSTASNKSKETGKQHGERMIKAKEYSRQNYIDVVIPSGRYGEIIRQLIERSNQRNMDQQEQNDKFALKKDFEDWKKHPEHFGQKSLIVAMMEQTGGSNSESSKRIALLEEKLFGKEKSREKYKIFIESIKSWEDLENLTDNINEKMANNESEILQKAKNNFKEGDKFGNEFYITNYRMELQASLKRQLEHKDLIQVVKDAIHELLRNEKLGSSLMLNEIKKSIEDEEVKKKHHALKKKIGEEMNSHKRPIKDCIDKIKRSLSAIKTASGNMEYYRIDAEKGQKYITKFLEEVTAPTTRDIFKDKSDIPQSMLPQQALEEGLKFIKKHFFTITEIDESINKIQKYLEEAGS